MASAAAELYRTLPASERQEFRLPALLKEHLALAATQRGQTLAEYITTTLAERVTVDLATSTEWRLTVDEQAALARLLTETPAEPSTRARQVAKRADALFGPLRDRRR